MTQSELNEAVATKTGESLRTIRRRGFSVMEPLSAFDPEDEPNSHPQVVDWDEVDVRRHRQVA